MSVPFERTGFVANSFLDRNTTDDYRNVLIGAWMVLRVVSVHGSLKCSKNPHFYVFSVAKMFLFVLDYFQNYFIRLRN